MKERAPKTNLWKWHRNMGEHECEERGSRRAVKELSGQIRIQQEEKIDIQEDRDAERSTEQTEKNEGRGRERKEERIGGKERCGDRGRGVGWLVCRGLAAFDREEKTFERQWLATSLSLSLSLPLSLYLSHPVIAEDCRGRGVASASKVMDGYYMGDRMCVWLYLEVEAIMRWKRRPDGALHYFSHKEKTFL